MTVPSANINKDANKKASETLRVYKRKPDGSWECAKRTVKTSKQRNHVKRDVDIFEILNNSFDRSKLDYGENYHFEEIKNDILRFQRDYPKI